MIYKKWSEKEIRELKTLVKSKENIEIAKLFKVSTQSASRFLNRHSEENQQFIKIKITWL